MASPESQVAKRGTRVFISYSHKDEAWKDLVVTHLKPLVHQGDLVLWDDRKIGTGADWYPKIEEELEKADIAVCLISADYLASDFINKEEIPAMKRRRKEEGMLLLPLLLSPCAWKAVKWLKGIQMFPRDGLSLEEIKPKVRQKKALADFVVEISERIAAADLAIPAPVPALAPPEKVDLARLPETGVQLFGRQKELQLLDELWDSGSANVVSLVAWGGVGKSTLVNQWLEYLKADNYRGAQRVYAWSFYSQGTGQRVTSADQFISEALLWFGDPDPRQGSSWDKGARLAELVRAERTLLVLDGLEPLQSGYEFDKGKINDPALSVLVTQLARLNNGLCVVSTREKIAELEHHRETALEVDLDQISKQAGRALLRVGGAQGTDDELEAASEAFGNHALAVSLLATYLHGIEGHHISNAASIPDLDLPDAKGRHPRRVIEAFHTRFADSPQTQVLRIMGLFDRPPEMALIDAVKAPPPIAGLTDNLLSLTDRQWHEVLDELRGCRLLAQKSTHNPTVLDCHPLIREHFADTLRSEQPEAWQAAHRRLYEHLTQSTEPQPDTLAGLGPLYQAVAHGCQAGMQQEACDKVYFDRILRGEENYSIDKLGAVGSDLAAVACFFERPFSAVSKQLSESDQAWLLNEAATRLRALGRLTEALEPMRAGLDNYTKQKDRESAAQVASNLSELELTLGQVAKSVEDAERSVDYADRSGDAFQRMATRTTLADALFQAGQADKAAELFGQAEGMQAERQPEYPLLYSLPSFRYCDLLLAPAERTAWQGLLQLRTQDSTLNTATAACPAVKKRATQTLEWEDGMPGAPILDIAFHHLSLDRAALYQAILANESPVTSHESLDRAVDGLRRAGQVQYLPCGLLSRALLRFVERNTDGCKADLDEAWQIAERGSMKLFMADVHLHRARLFHDQEELGKARELIEHCGYHRRDPELADAEQAAQDW
jgi:tetratricopeptide (TPR) repeat protein